MPASIGNKRIRGLHPREFEWENKDEYKGVKRRNNRRKNKLARRQRKVNKGAPKRKAARAAQVYM